MVEDSPEPTCMTPDGLVFDLDGTLWDAAAASTLGWNLALEEMGAVSRVTVDDIRSVSGFRSHNVRRSSSLSYAL